MFFSTLTACFQRPSTGTSAEIGAAGLSSSLSPLRDGLSGGGTGASVSSPQPDQFVASSRAEATVLGRENLKLMDRTVKSRHATLSQEGILTDLGSRYGTFVNGQLITEPRRLQADDLIRLGRSGVYYRYDGNRLRPVFQELGADFTPQGAVRDLTLSRKHALLKENGNLTDLQSRTGTYVDGKRIAGSTTLRNGNLVQLGEWGITQFYYDQGRLKPLTPEKAKLLRTLFPDGLLHSDFKQGQIGNCTFLSALKATLHNNPAKIIEILDSQDENGQTALVRFKDSLETQALSQSDFKRQGVRGPLGVKLLETAFGRHLKPDNELDTVLVLDEGGYASQAIKALTSGKEPHMIFNNGQPLDASPQVRERCLQALKSIEKDPANRIAVSSACKALPEKQIIPAHAYAVLDVNTEKKVIQLANPHNTQRSIHLSFDEFLKCFRRLVMARLH